MTTKKKPTTVKKAAKKTSAKRDALKKRRKETAASPLDLALVGVAVREWRALSNQTQAVSAQRAGINVRHWQKLEAGKLNATLSTLFRVARSLNADPWQLLLSIDL